MVAGNQQYILQFSADTTQMTSSLRKFAGDASGLLGQVSAAAKRTLDVSGAAAPLAGGDLLGAGRALQPQFSALGEETRGAALAGGANERQARALSDQAVNQALQETGAALDLTKAEISQLNASINFATREFAELAGGSNFRATLRVAFGRLEDEVRRSTAIERLTTEEALQARVARIGAERLQSDTIRAQAALDQATNVEALAQRAERVVAENLATDIVQAGVEGQVQADSQLLTAKIERAVAESLSADLVQQEVAATQVADAALIEAKTDRAITEGRVADIVAAGVAEEQVTNEQTRVGKTRRAAAESRAADVVATDVAAESLASDTVIKGKVDRALVEETLANQVKQQASEERVVSEQALRAKARRIVAEGQEAEALIKLTREENKLANVTRARARANLSRASQAGATGATGQTPGEFLGGGIRQTLRFAIPSALLFGAASGIRSIVEEAEELEQINVRLQAQFENLSGLRVFDNLIESFGELPNAANRAAVATLELNAFRDAAAGISQDTGVATDQVLELGSSFVGLFASFDGVDGDFRSLAEEATRITSEFSVITGLDPQEAFNDLVGAVRTFADEAPDVNVLLAQLSDDLISVADVSGVAAEELADFVGRIAPVSETAGFLIEEVAAIGGALLQASGLGGAQLAEQFGRIVSTFGDGLDEELAGLAVEVPEIGLNLEDIFSGNTKDVLFQLIEGFEGLTEAQQRQIIASVGSRREGNTLATLLQNNTAVFTALEAQQDNAGAAGERLAQVQETLTVRFNQLKVQLEQLGQQLLQGGLGDILQDLVAVASIFADVIATVLGPAVAGLSKLFEIFPPELLAFAAAVAIGSSAMKSLGTSLNFVQQAFRTGGLAGGLNDIGGAARGATTATSGFRVASRALGGALGVAGIAMTGYSLITSVMAANAARARKEIDDFTTALRDSGSDFVTIADRARELNVELEETIRLQDAAASGGTQTGQFDESVGFGAGLVSLARGRDDLEDINKLLAASGLNANEFAAELIRISEETGRLSIPEGKAAIGGSAGDRSFDRLLGEEPSESRVALVEALNKLANDEGLSQGQLIDVFDSLVDATNAAKGTADDQANAVSDFLDTVQAANAQDEEIRGTIAELKATRDGTVSGDVNFVEAARDAFPELAAVQDALSEAESEQQKLRDEINAGLGDLAVVRAQLGAGLVTQEQFAEAAGEEVIKLRQQLTAAAAVGDGEQVARILSELTAIEKEASDIAVARAEADQRILELLGEPIDGLDRLRAIALDVAIQRDPEAFGEAVDNLITAEKDVAIEAASRAQSAEDATRALEDFSLSVETGDLFVEQQIRAEGGALVEQILGLEGELQEDIDAIFAQIAADVNAGATLEQALRTILEARLAELETLVGTVDAIAVDGFVAEINSIRETISGLGSAGIPNVAAGGDVGINTDVIEDVAGALSDQYELILEGIERDSQILRAFGIDNTPDALAAEATRLAQLLSDPGFTDSEARFEVAVQLAGVLQSIAQLEADEMAAANQAIELLTNGIDVDALVTAEAVFSGIQNQSSAFGVFVNAYLDVGEDVLNGLARSIAEFVAGGANATEALRKALEKQIAQLSATIFVGGFGSSAENLQPFIDLQKDLQDKLNGLNDAVIPDIDIGGIDIPNIGPNTGGGAQDDAENAAADLAAAQFELLRAQFALDPVALARIAQREAADALRRATTAADRVRAQAAGLNADREFAQAIQDVFNAQTDLAITLAEIAGDTEGALALGVEQAETQLQFLRDQGAGEAAIADAEAAVEQAREREFEGLINDQLGDLDFLFNIGELTTQAYIAQLQAILATLDPVADEDLFRDLTLQIQDLRGRTNDLSTNLGNFDIPSLFEVRRLAQTGFGGTPDQAGPGGNVDNRTINVTMNISDGVSWEDAVDVINDAIGTDAPVTFETRRY